MPDQAVSCQHGKGEFCASWNGSFQSEIIEIPTYIRNHEAVVSAFGYWPSFHDAPVHAFAHTSNEIALALHAWEMTSQVDARGYFILRKHHIVRFVFHGITETDIVNFIPGNILYELKFSPSAKFDAAGQFTVNLDSVIGSEFCGSFTASSGEVTAVLPCDKHGKTA